MSVVDKVNHCLHPLLRKRAFNAYRAEIKHFRQISPDSYGTVGVQTIQRHMNLWRSLDPGLTPDWLELLSKIGGREDYRYVPSTVYYGVIERCLNNCNVAGGGVEDKNLMAFYVPLESRARCILRYVRGVFFDDDFCVLSRSQANDVLKSYPDDVVGKIAVDSSGGHSVELFRNVVGRKESSRHALTAEWIESHTENYVVQERLVQEPEVSRFNPSSINTCRLMTFRRPWDGETQVVASMLRLGCSTDIVDNISSGGVSVGVSPDGVLHPLGLTAKFRLVDKHPGTRLPFAGFRIPGYDKMRQAACKIAARVPDFNLLGFDMMICEDGRPCVIEINASSLCCIEVQMSGPMFGEDTEKVVEWCLANRRLDTFKHLRTWY